MKKTLVSLLCICSLSLTACIGGSDKEDLGQWMQTASAGLHGKVEPLPELLAYQPYDIQYAAAGSPFAPQRLEEARRKAQGNRPNTNRAREILENYELNQLRLTGTINQSKQYFGLIQTPDGAIYRVKPGNYIGPNFGVVKRITETELALEETVEDINGEWIQQETSLYLLQQDQGQKP